MKSKAVITFAFITALLFTGVTSYIIGSNSQQTQPETVTAEVVAQQEPYTPPDTITADRIFELVNIERVNAGVQSLVRDAQLDASAKAKCDDLVTRNYYAHEDPDGKMPWHFFIEAGYKYKIAGENLADRRVAASKTVYDWMNSPKHKENIVNSVYRDTGVAVCGLTNMTVQHFGVR